MFWESVPGMCKEDPILEYYPTEENKNDKTAVVIFPGGGYHIRAPHEGKGYAEYLNTLGIDAFVCEYRVTPNFYPLPLLDARRAVQYVRANAEKFGINPKKIGVMGSSAGGHLAATLCTVFDIYDNVLLNKDKTDEVDFIPNFQILCYPVISLKDFGHQRSKNNLLGDKSNDEELVYRLSAHNSVNKKTPKAFIWHTFDDNIVNVNNSLSYAQALKKFSIDCELHIFPNGSHGLGLAQHDNSVGQWSALLKNWLAHFELIKSEK